MRIVIRLSAHRRRCSFIVRTAIFRHCRLSFFPVGHARGSAARRRSSQFRPRATPCPAWSSHGPRSGVGRVCSGSPEVYLSICRSVERSPVRPSDRSSSVADVTDVRAPNGVPKIVRGSFSGEGITVYRSEYVRICTYTYLPTYAYTYT